MNLLYLISKLIKKIHIPAIKNSIIDKKSKICSGSHIVNSKLGKYSYIGNFCTILNVQVGNYCSIADNCIIGGASHPIEWVSTSPVFYNGRNVLKKHFARNEYTSGKVTIIGNDVWIGNNCLIKSGVKIGNGAIIGMGSVLTKDVGEYEIWGGNPARLIRKRFDDLKIKQLIESNWWNRDDDFLYEVAPYFNNINDFLNHIKLGE
jgi:acetyltransferase-like isoleucine patch superfamily enzyme